ncbi:sigma 54-interacting transcriptional regulator [Irregularibacter muris]|uniref:Sigma 54-interacting transcriptional regulator n=1 Tax=Irregularibacter muris TaxID=1796619 RepID=A0AAE3HCH6_9FIRM|nr:sigma 54-interacting transcriptional regulator [Irregularibacter muris]MCR1897396.1 sigma 54-interacting transcriptional regulator [Irregularibacter muris]
MQTKDLHHIKKAFKETDVICIIDKEGKILYYNNYNDIHNKLGTEDVVGKPLLEVYPWLTEETSTALNVLRTGQAIINQPQVVQLGDGTDVNAINTAFPLKNKEGILGAVSLSYDINSITTPPVPKSLKSRKHNLGARYTFEDIITQNADMIGIINRLKKVSKHNSNIFIYGETGTGKELFVHAIHNASRRSSMPFISQNCAAIPETLMESLIFGTVEGSFTGAVNKKGLFELANGGTIFLDEINSMPLSLQAKLLRVIEDRKVRRIGGNAEFETDVRIIASTNEPPDKLLKNNKFRRDLFYRLSVVNTEIPPLRERKGDIQLLCNHFIHEFNRMFEENVKGLEAQVKKLFMQYHWPGNIREFKNCIEGAFNSVEGNLILLQDIPSYIGKSHRIEMNDDGIDFKIQKELSLRENTEVLEKYLIVEALKKAEKNITRASNLLEIPRQSLYNKLKKYDISQQE